LAIIAAREKAIDLAGKLGQKIDKPYKIQENASGWWSWYNAWWGSRWRGGMSQNVIQNVASPSESDSSIALGQIKVNAKITVSFELE
ncbi:MAG: SIMPL domain-containing protein, partial [Desulfobacteraceae bacterium]